MESWIGDIDYVLYCLSPQTAPDNQFLSLMKILVIHLLIRYPYFSDIQNHKDISIFYNEHKRILEFLRKEVQTKYNELNPVLQNIKNEVEGGKEYQENLKRLENKRLLLKIKLAETKNKKLELLKRSADIKFGPFLANKTEILLDEYMYNQAKFERLKVHILHLYLNSTRNVMKAIEQVNKYLDDISNKC